MKAICTTSRGWRTELARLWTLGVSLATAMAVVGGCSTITGQQVAPTVLPAIPELSGVTVEGRLEPVHFVNLALNADGLVDEVLVHQGDQVVAGQLLLRLETSGTQTLEEARSRAAVEFGGAQEAVRLAQKELDAYPLPRIFVGLTAQQAAQIWLDNLDSARAEFAPYVGTSRKTLKPNHHIFPSLPRRIWFDTDEYHGVAKEYNKQVDVAWMNYRKAVEWLVLDSALASARARLLQARTNYDGLQDAASSQATAGVRGALADSELRAPFAGTITNLDTKLGEHVSSGQPVATLGDFSNWIAKTTDLTEIDVVNVAVGEPVKVTLDAVPGRVFDGRVLGIDLNYSERQGDIVYAATILLGEHDPQMRWGMTAQVTLAE